MAIFKEGDRVKLSTKGRYGLRALIDLAQYSEQTPVSITSISSRQDLSERYLEQLMSMLKKAGAPAAGMYWQSRRIRFRLAMCSERWRAVWNR